MPIPFTCPHCGHQTIVADQYAGQTGPCASCSKPVTIPEMVMSPGPRSAKSSGTPVTLIVVVVIGVFVVCGGILAAVLLPTFYGARNAGREASLRSQCSNNLKQIGLAMHNYHDVYNSFPPAYIPDEDGQPMHSWRVLILPFMEQMALYDMYDFNVPWDDPKNLALLNSTALDAYQCPNDNNIGLTETNYMMIVGPGTISDGPNASTFGDITDGTSNTILIVETTGTGINWFEPVDLDTQNMDYSINASSGQAGIRSNHPGEACVLLADGSIHFLDDLTPKEQIELMSTIADGQVVEIP